MGGVRQPDTNRLWCDLLGYVLLSADVVNLILPDVWLDCRIQIEMDSVSQPELLSFRSVLASGDSPHSSFVRRSRLCSGGQSAFGHWGGTLLFLQPNNLMAFCNPFTPICILHRPKQSWSQTSSSYPLQAKVFRYNHVLYPLVCITFLWKNSILRIPSPIMFHFG